MNEEGAFVQTKRLKIHTRDVSGLMFVPDVCMVYLIINTRGIRCSIKLVWHVTHEQRDNTPNVILVVNANDYQYGTTCLCLGVCHLSMELTRGRNRYHQFVDEMNFLCTLGLGLNNKYLVTCATI